MIDLGLLDEALKRVEKAYMNQRTPDALSVMKLMGAARAYRDLVNGERVEWRDFPADTDVGVAAKRIYGQAVTVADWQRTKAALLAVADARRTEEGS